MNIIHNIWIISHELAPWLLLGTLISALIHRFLPTGFIHQQLQGKLGVLKAVLFGVPLPLCSCGVIPAGLGLKKDGSGSGATIGFIISTPQTGVDSVLVSAGFLGWPFAMFKIVAAGLTGIIGGFLADALIPEPKQAVTHSHSNKSVSWQETWEHGLDIIQSIWKWLLFGIVLSAIISEYISPNQFQTMGTLGTFSAMIGALLLSLPLYVCATASVPIAAALVHSGFPVGAALVFLMAGPATNIATIGAVKQELGTKATTIYLLTVIVGSLLLGWGFDFLLTDIPPLMIHDHAPALWESISVFILFGLCLYFFAQELQGFFSSSPPTDQSIEVCIEGLNCGGCVNKLTKALNSDSEIAHASVSLAENKAFIQTTLSREEIKERVESAGFSVPSP